MSARLLIFVLALLASSADAHDARSSSVDVNVVGSLVTVHVAATQAGLHAALEAAARHAIDARGDGYQALVAEHLRRTLRLSADGQPLAIGDVGLRLGDHQSDARIIVELPEGASDLALAVESFDGVEGQQTVVRIRHNGETTRTVLSDASGRTASVSLAPPSPEASGETVSGDEVSDDAASGVSRVGWVFGLSLAGLVVALPLLVVAARRSSAE